MIKDIKLKADRFRSSKTCAILRTHLKAPTDFDLHKWILAAAEDFEEWCYFVSNTKREATALRCAELRIEQGARIFADRYWPQIADYKGWGPLSAVNREAYRQRHVFLLSTFRQVRDIARLNTPS